MWNFERKWAKNNFLICRALLGNGVVWVCLQGGGDADWVSCWLSWLTMWLNQGDCWQSWMIWMMTWYVFTGAGCAMSWMTIFWLNGERWLRHWMVGNGVESECVCGGGWVLVRSVECVCVRGVLLTELDYIDDDFVCVHWGWVCNELDDYILIVVGVDWVTGWLGNGGESECVCVVLVGCWLGLWIVCVCRGRWGWRVGAVMGVDRIGW